MSDDLRPVSPGSSQALRTRIEEELAQVTRMTIRDFVNDVREATLSGLTSVVASAEPLPRGEIPPLGSQAGRWAAGVDDGILKAIESAFALSWRHYTRRGITVDSPAERAMRSYLATVRDRLVRGTHFGVPVYQDSYAAVRRALAQSASEGWTRQQLAQRIAAELSWEKDGHYWRGVKATTDHQMDKILDAIGKPGDPAREYARLHDPRILALREQRNLAIKHLDAERSLWQTRAMLISRTESTGVANYGALNALSAEGVTSKVWVATSDGRTRLTHAEAAGQEVKVSQPFDVGGYSLQFPGDPNGPVEEVANCRCTIIAADALLP